MSKKQLQQFLTDLDRKALEAQIVDLYQRFPIVKKFYDFSFNPNEEKLWEEAKFKIAKEYFPIKGKKAKLRPSVAQKLIRHYRKLEVDPEIVVDIMLYNLEIAQSYFEEKPIKRKTFFKSMQNSFEEAIDFIETDLDPEEFYSRIALIIMTAHRQSWPNAASFDRIYNKIS